jgi:fumarate reductase subunit C
MALSSELKDFAHGSRLTAKFLELLAKPIVVILNAVKYTSP